MARKSQFSILFGTILLSIFAFSQFSYADLSFSDEFGSSGTGDDEFKKPSDLAISRDGTNLYVVDSDNNRIKIFELTGGDNCPSGTDEVINDEVCFDDDFGSSGSSDGRFDIPTNLAINLGSGDIYVIDSDNNRVQKFNANGNFDNLTFGSSDNDNDEYLGTPSAIAVHEETDYIYVADSTTDSISVFDDNGNFKFNFDDDGSNDGFKNSAGMVIDNDDDILYVSDTDNNRIRMFELTDDSNCLSGTDEVVNDEVCFIDDFGSSGNGEGKFDEPSGLAFDEDNKLLYVADTENNQVQAFEIISGNTCPSDTDEVIDGVCFVEEFGSSGSSDGMFNSPTGLAFDEDNGMLYVSDRDNNRVQILSLPTGGSSSSSSSSSSFDDVPISPKGVSASTASKSSIIVTWNVPDPDDNDPEITGYKIESREGNDSYETIVADTKTTTTSYLHTGLDDDESYRYKIYAINSEGTSSASSTASAKPGSTNTPAGLTAIPISKSQVLLSWFPPTETFNQSISGYLIEREVIPGVLYDKVGETNGGTTTYTVSGLATGKTYSFVVSANLSLGNTPRSNVASATPELNSEAPSGSSSSITVPTSPRSLSAAESSSQIKLSWTAPSDDGNSKVTGYKIEVKKDSESSYSTLKSTTSATSYTDSDVQVGSTYAYRVYAINSVGTSSSSQVSATPQDTTLQLSPLGAFTIDENKTFSFTARLTDSSIKNAAFGLGNSPPTGAKINSSTGLFTWTPTNSQGAKSYIFDITVTKDSMIDRQSITLIVNDVKISEPTKEPVKEPTANTDTDPKELGIASFVDESKDPQSYVDRYENEATYKKWFDENFAEYNSIYHAVGLEEPAVEEEEIEEKKFGICGPGTKLIDGVCTVVEVPSAKPWWKFW